MNVAEMKEYLAMAIDCENVLENYDKMLHKLESEISQLKRDMVEVAETENVDYVPQAISKPAEPTWSISDSIYTGLFVSFGCFIVCFIIFVIAWGKDDAFAAGLIGFIVGVVGFIITLCYGINVTEKEEERINTETEAYERAIKNEKARAESINKQRQKEMDDCMAFYTFKIAYLTKQKSLLINLRSRTRKNRDQIYSLNVIHQKYRVLPFLVLIYECFDTGRTDKLEGQGGAYNMVELDYRLDDIRSKLSTIISQLGDVKGILSAMKNDIRRLEQSLQSIHSDLGSISQDIGCINYNFGKLGQQVADTNSILQNARKTYLSMEVNSALLAYRQERTAREVEYANRINYYRRTNTTIPLSEYRPPSMPY